MQLTPGTWVYQDPDFPHRRGYEWSANLWTIKEAKEDAVACEHINSAGITIRQTFPSGSLHVFPASALRETPEHGRTRCAWTDDDGRRHAIIVMKDDLDRFDASQATAVR